jgi:predicted aminopeptidase
VIRVLGFFSFAVLAAGLLSACSGVRYYAQAINGHAQLLHDTQSIQALLEEESGTSAAQKARFKSVLEIRAFASERLALPDNDSYRRFSELDRTAVLWSLVATPEFSVSAIQWCYPIIGCATYRGYFSQQDAQQAALEQAAKGRDVAVNPVAAYSTLGWFADPLPSTVIDWPLSALAGLMFHELAHQQIYIPDDSAFNESFASAVERAGVRSWLASHGNAAQREQWERRQRREQAFVALLMQTRERLRDLYEKPLPAQAIRIEKQAEFQRLRERYQQLRSVWENDAGYDKWFARPLNNARFALVNTYEQWVPAFTQLLTDQQDDFAAFYRAVEQLSQLPKAQRDERLRHLMGSAQAKALASNNADSG